MEGWCDDVTEKVVDNSLEITEKIYHKFTIEDFLKSSSEMGKDIWESLLSESLDRIKKRRG